MILSEDIIGDLARITSINANKIVRTKTTGYQRPHAKRANIIQDICTRSKTDLPLNYYYSTLLLQKLDSVKAIDSKK